MKKKFLIFFLVFSVGVLLFFALHKKFVPDKKNKPTDVVSVGSETVYFSSNRSGHYEIYLTDKGIVKKITDDSRYDSWWPRVSSMKDKIIFYRSPAKNKNNNYEEAQLWEMSLDGKSLKKIIDMADNHWKAQGVADWSPDGKRLVMAALDVNSNRWNLYITNAEGKDSVQISKRKSLYLDPSFSPDGKKVVCIAFP